MHAHQHMAKKSFIFFVYSTKVPKTFLCIVTTQNKIAIKNVRKCISYLLRFIISQTAYLYFFSLFIASIMFFLAAAFAATLAHLQAEIH